MYIAPSRGHILFNLNMPFKIILLRRLRLFYDVWSEEMLHFLKDLWKFIQIHQYYIGLLWLEENLRLKVKPSRNGAMG